jgi:protein TonB
MFEQALLMDANRRGRWWTFAAMGGQTAALGLAVIVPMLFTEKLGLRAMLKPIFLEPPRPFVEQTGPARGGGSATGLRAPRAIRVLVVSPRVPVGVSFVMEPLAAGLSLIGHGTSGVPDGGSGLGVPYGTGTMDLPAPPPKPDAAPPAAPPPPTQPGPVRVGGKVQEARILQRPLPVYPVLAKQARISGTVQLVGTIGKDGRIEQLQVIGGHPLLVKAALDAVRRWVYRPTLLNNEPVEVIAPIEVHFKLGE